MEGRGGLLVLQVGVLVVEMALGQEGEAGRELGEMEGLVQAHVLFRHGDRTPCNFYPTDPHSDPAEWPVGPGQLTATGKMMHYRLGQWLRERYTGFLGPDYSEQEVRVRSTDIDRTLMSAMSNLAGLFPPTAKMAWLPGFPWQPVPVHTLPVEQDRILGEKAKCPKAEQLFKEVMEGEEMKELLEQHADLLDYIYSHSGKRVDSVMELDYLYDTLLVESIYNRTLPEWTKAVFPGGEFEKLRLLAFSVATSTHELARLRGGPLIKDLVDHWIARREEKEGKLLYMYSGHDTTISAVLNSLGVFNGLAPPYASAVLIELLKRDEGLVVRLAYRNDTAVAPYPLAIPGCPHLCPLDRFLTLTADLLPEDWEAECQLDMEEVEVVPQLTSTHIHLLITTSCVTTALLALLVLLLLRLTCTRRTHQEEGEALKPGVRRSQYQRL